MSYQRCLWFIASIVLINGGVILITSPITVPFVKGIVLLAIIYYLFHQNQFIFNYREIPSTIRHSLAIYLISIIIISLLDSTAGLTEKVTLVINDFISTYIYIIFGFLLTKKSYDFDKMVTPMIFILISITIYGLYNFITQTNPYHELITVTYQSQSATFDSQMLILVGWDERYRVNSTISSPFDYGYYSTVLGIVSVYGYYLNKKNKLIPLIGIICSLTGAVLCNCRTVLAVWIVSFIIYFFANTKLSKLPKTIITISALAFASYFLIPMVQTSINNLLDLLTTGGSQGGSSIQMRILQLLSAIKIFLESPILGHGLNYINRILGWGTETYTSTEDLAGFESIIYQVMIEKGIVGIISIYLIIRNIIVYFRKMNKIDKNISALGISITVAFLTYAIATGPLGSYPLSMFIIGILIKTTTLKYNEKASYHYPRI
jgi:hypothetical protein